jgi:hypothetical protein
MRLLANALFCLAILSTIPLSRATPVDPQISVGDPSAGTALDSGTFFFKSDANGGGIFDFTNDSGNVWQTLDFFATLPASDTIACGSTFYRLCDYTSTPAVNGQAIFDIGFEQPLESGGIGPGVSFSIDLNTVADVDRGGWGADNSIEGVANFDLPEPASWFLTAAGLLVCAIRALYRRAA